MALTVGGTAKEDRAVKVKRSKTSNPVTQLLLGRVKQESVKNERLNRPCVKRNSRRVYVYWI